MLRQFSSNWHFHSVDIIAASKLIPHLTLYSRSNYVEVLKTMLSVSHYYHRLYLFHTFTIIPRKFAAFLSRLYLPLLQSLIDLFRTALPGFCNSYTQARCSHIVAVVNVLRHYSHGCHCFLDNYYYLKNYRTEVLDLELRPFVSKI